jgi:glycosyltransferase involved in cell wall biosynthesis
VRICLVYDHLYPATVGGGERWMHDLSVALVAAGHDVTYLTMQHWKGAPPVIEGVEIVGLVPAGTVYADGRRSLGPPARFGLAVARYLLRRGQGFDVVHTAAFPYFPMLAAGLARRRSGYRLVADWYEVWTRGYWRRYAGPIVGTAGWLVQRRCVRLRHRAFCISRLTERRLLEEGFDGEHAVLPGLYAGPVVASPATVAQPVVVYAGRHVAEKRVTLLVEAFAVARRTVPSLRLVLFGDGPDRQRAETAAARLEVADAVEFRGRRPQVEVDAAFAGAACVASASEREGYGLIVVEAAARGTPSVVTAGPENASTELIADGVNGAVAAEPTAEAIGSAIVDVVCAGADLRESTLGWFVENAERLRIERSLELVTRSYAGTNR